MQFNIPKGAVAPSSLEFLRRSSGWMKFMAVLMFIGAAFVLVLGVFLGTIGSYFLDQLASKAADKVPMIGLIAGMGALLAVIGVVLAAVTVYQGYCMLSAANAAQRSPLGDVNYNLQQYAKHFKNYLTVTVIFGAIGILFSVLTLFSSL